MGESLSVSATTSSAAFAPAAPDADLTVTQYCGLCKKVEQVWLPPAVAVVQEPEVCARGGTRSGAARAQCGELNGRGTHLDEVKKRRWWLDDLEAAVAVGREGEAKVGCTALVRDDEVERGRARLGQEAVLHEAASACVCARGVRRGRARSFGLSCMAACRRATSHEAVAAKERERDAPSRRAAAPRPSLTTSSSSSRRRGRCTRPSRAASLSVERGRARPRTAWPGPGRSRGGCA